MVEYPLKKLDKACADAVSRFLHYKFWT